uniref:Transposase n=1 Tax=Globodera rostochiensis TaxID=31243 RepID=A0A914HPT9_GLORO
MPFTKSTGRTPKLDKLNPIQLIRILLCLITLDKLNPIQLIRILFSQKKFDQKKAELKRDGFKNAYHHEIDETVARELGLSVGTIYNWKRKLGQTKPQHSQNEQKELMKHYYEIKDKTPQIIDEDIAKILKIGRRTLIRWKRQFKRQQFHQNSVDGHSLEENAVANVQEIENSIE